MPPEAEVLIANEPTKTVEAPRPIETPKAPVVTRPDQPKWGDKYKDAFAKLEKVDTPGETPVAAQEVKEPEKPAEAPVSPKPTPEPPPPASKPLSALDAAMGEIKPSPPEETLPDKLEGASEKVNENWKRARAKIDTLMQELERAKTAPAQQDNRYSALKEELDGLKARYSDQETRLKAINAEYSDEYRGMLSERESIVQKIGKRVDAFGGDPEKLISALNLPEGKVKSGQIKEALSELDSDDKARVHTLIESLDSHDEKIDKFRSDLPAQFDRMVKTRDAQEQAFIQENLRAMETEFGKITAELPKTSVTLREIPTEVPGAEEWNSEIKSARDTALAVLKPNNADFTQTVNIAMKGARYDSLEARYIALHKEHAATVAKLREYEGAGPDFKGTPAPSKPQKSESMAARYHEALAKINAAQADL
jgi:predicted  nucleic acid-binding Zn-ribbon protein